MRNSFTLIEVMIVVVILGLLAAIVVPNLMGESEKAKKKIVCVQMRSIADALKSFKLQYGRYPLTKEGLHALIKNPDPGKYKDYPSNGFLDATSLPKDPWNNPYIYINRDGAFDILSLGADGKEGGKGEDADISWQQCRR